MFYITMDGRCATPFVEDADASLVSSTLAGLVSSKHACGAAINGAITDPMHHRRPSLCLCGLVDARRDHRRFALLRDHNYRGQRRPSMNDKAATRWQGRHVAGIAAKLNADRRVAPRC